jgi:hypothetical protein
MLESVIFGTLFFLKMSVVRILELIAKIAIAKIGIAKIRIQIGIDHYNHDPDWERLLKLGLLKLGSDLTIASGECEPASHNRLAHHHCDQSAMPPANHLTTFLHHHPCNPTYFLPLLIT